MASKVQQLSEHIFYIPGGVNTVILQQDRDAIFFDTGGDKNSGRELKKAVQHLGLQPRAIINSHSHADHYGGNQFLLKAFDIPVYAPELEASIMRQPYLEPVYLFNGAAPPAELLNKWLLAKPSPVDSYLQAGAQDIEGFPIEIIDTSGHSHQQISAIYDGVLLAADALFGTATLERYPLPFGQNIGEQMASAEKLRGIEIAQCLPGHGEATGRLEALIHANLQAFERAAQAVLNAVEGNSTEAVLQKSCSSLGITMNDMSRYYLNQCVVQAYLSHLKAKNMLYCELQENELRWYRHD